MTFSRLRIAAGLLAALTTLASSVLAQPPPRQIPDEVLIKFKRTAPASERALVRANLHAQTLHDFSRIGVEHLKVQGMTVDQAIQRYRNNPHVEFIEPNYEIHAELVPNDPRFPEMYGLRNTGQTGGTAGADIKAVNAWDVFTGNPNTMIGVIDTGVDYNHPDLAANVWTNPGEIPGNSIDDDHNGYVDDVHGYDFFNNDGDPFDDNGHGTHCSGTIAAVGNNNIGVTGVNWNAKIVGIKFLSSGGSGSTDGAIAGVNYAITVGVRLTSNSWGGGGFSQALLDAINAAGAAGQLFVAAAGNSSANTDVSPHYPSAYNSPYIIAVAASDHNDNLASFSNYGATTVDLAAPGDDILSTLPGNSYGLLSGTSMATPHVSGVVGLTWGRFPSMQNLLVKDLILNRVDVKASLQGRVLTNGRLNAFMTIADPDTLPPGAVANLSTSDPSSNALVLHWTATGDDGGTGRASSYDIRYSTSPITDANFGLATPVTGPDPQTAGSAETFEVGGLDFSTTYYFALKALDEYSNPGPLSNVATGTTLGIPDITAAPASFMAELLTGGTDTQVLTLTNDGAGTLDFTIPTPVLAFSTPVIFPYVPLAKGEDDWRIGAPVTDSQGGPDAAGYRWMDSNEPGGPAFSWVDITGVGTQLALTGDDAISPALPLGMSFPFYGTSFNSVRVCTNGFLSFTDGSTAFDNQLLPNSGAPANLLAAFWDDLDFGTTPRVYTYFDGIRFIVSWVGAPHYQSGGPYTFQAILYPTGEIVVQYQTMGAPTNSATVGIQNAAKSIGLTTAYNTDYVVNGLAVRFAQVPQWLTVSPTSGRIHAGQSQLVQVHFDASGLLGGNYSGSIHVQSNDPDESDVALTASLHVIGAPDIGVTPASLAFGTVFVGASPTQNLTVSNPGTDDLVITGITSDDAFVTTAPSSFTLPPRSAQLVTVTYHPTSVRATNATLSIASNDPDSPTTTVAVTGDAVPAPSFSVNPESFDVSLLTNTATTQNLRVTNSGGSNYVFTAQALAFAASGTVDVQGDADNVFIDKGMQDVLSGPQAEQSGGPDVFGYTYQDSDAPGGPTFSWVDIRAVGTNIPMTGDDVNTGPYPIGFNFPFYGTNFSNFRISTNGFVSFTSTLSALSNTTLPNTGSGVPENLLAVFWDDMNFLTVRRAYYYNDGTRLIIQYQEVPRFGDSTHPNTFEIILYPTGQIVYQYLSITATTRNSHTIGMQNAAKTDGLQVVFNNAAYIHDGLAIRFRPPARFLTVTPPSGSVPPGGFVDLTVGFNAAGLFGGDYHGAVRLSGNDPILPQRDVPATLHVTGVPDLATTPTSIDFGDIFVGFPALRQLTVLNVGTDDLTVTNIVPSHPAYGVDQTAFTIPPLGSAVVFVSFSPPGPGAVPATLTIASDDPDSPNTVVPLAGNGLIPPDVGVAPTSLAATLPIPGSDSRTLTVSNTGGSELNFVAGTLLTASEVTVYEDLPLGKGDVDPRQGILGSGGPDLFGYTWRDSDEPSGPIFDWVDISGIGTPLVLASDDETQTGILLGFDFPYYGGTFNSVNVCSNGWLSFTNTTTDFTNDPLPNSGAPENLLAAFWDDLTLSSGRAYSYRDGTRFILAYVGVPRLGSGGPYTFEVILYPSGRIVYQYLEMQGTRLNEATIGIQNGARNDGLTVVHNANYVHNNLAIELRTIPDWMVVSPSSGTVPAGGSLDLQVALSSAGLFGGVYNGSVRITSNDPDEGVVNVPAVLTATGTTDIGVVPASLDFSWLYVSQYRDLVLQVRNEGSDVLTVSGASFTNPVYGLVGATFPLVLGNHGVANLTVRFAPTGECNPCSGELVLASNDPDEAQLHVPLTGIGIIPPEASVDPTSLHAATATTLGPTAIQKTKTLRLYNTGGSDLNWNAQALSLLPAALDMTPSAETGKDQPGLPGVAPEASGGPDAAGYRWADSDDPTQCPPFDWVDITGVGTQIPFTGDDQNQGPFPLPFPVTFYGNTFNSFRACTNGWISFTSTVTTFSNTTLPNAGSSVPENALAAFWDDLTFSAAGDVYYHYDGQKFIISYVNVPRLTSGGPYTFQILIYPSGTIDFQYLNMQGTRLNEATIGIQNGTKDIGLQVVFNAAYVKNNLRIRFSNAPGWLTVAPTSGTVPVGGHADLAVTFNATGLADGDYSGGVRIASNDLTNPTLEVPASMHVGVVQVAFDLDPGSLNRSSNGTWVSGWIEPGGSYDPHTILRPSVLLQRTVPVAPNSASSYGDPDNDGLLEVQYKFDRLQLSSLLPTGNAVPVEVIGEMADITWFAAIDEIRVLKPRVTTVAGGGEGTKDLTPTYRVAAVVQLDWEAPEGYTPDYYELWFSSDAGESWSLVAGNVHSLQYDWVVPDELTTAGLLELVAMDDKGVMGSWISPQFTITDTPTDTGPLALPTEYSVRPIGANPVTNGKASLELALPQDGPVSVRIYDVRGALVRDLVTSRPYPAGRHVVDWDATNRAGVRVSSGVYFVHTQAGAKDLKVRLTVLR